ncbi:hypothetical protein [Micromonospora tulbaghiae]|uniref:hypothetical protein n=1 Tax=Micromonospora tulbaghiae TaxID=479978 RepID=UPI0033F8F243
MSGLAERIADRLRNHQWHTPPEYPNIHASSAHNRHRFNADCAICVGDVDRIAAVAVTAVGEHVTSQLGGAGVFPKPPPPPFAKRPTSY